MAEFIGEELHIFLVTVGIGALMSASYDVLRILRCAIKHNVVAVSCEDVLYWMTWAVTTYGIFLFINDGRFRLYMIIGALTGAIVYHMILGRLAVKFFGKILRKFMEIIVKVLKNTLNSFKIKLISKKNENNENNAIRGGHIEKK